MTDDIKIKRMFVITPSVERKLKEMASEADRDRSAQLRVLISEAYDKKQKAKQAQASN